MPKQQEPSLDIDQLIKNEEDFHYVQEGQELLERIRALHEENNR